MDIARPVASEHKQLSVTVSDSQQLNLGTGFQVETAEQMAMDGSPMQQIIRTLDDMMSRIYVAARLDTLDYLRRSGRMNIFMAGLGSLLRPKPILTMKNGTPRSERVCTELNAGNHLAQMLKEKLPIERFALLHTKWAKRGRIQRRKASTLGGAKAGI